MEPRKASVSCTYNGANATVQIAEYLDSFTYTDVASGSSDSIKVTLNDRDRKWIGAWFPEKGDRLQPTIRTSNWKQEGDASSFPCGAFRVDDFSVHGGRPLQVTIEGVALPADSNFKTMKRTQTYEETNLQEIGDIIAGRAGIALYYEAGTVSIAKVEQSDQEDCDFYEGLVTKYGLALKIYNDKLVVFSEAAYEAKAAKATLTEADIEPGWEWNTTLDGTYTGVKYEYTNSEKDETITVEVGGGDRIYTCNEAADNPTEAKLIALAAVNNANKDATTLTNVTLSLAVPGLIASDCVEVAGIGKCSGKYYVSEITHTLGGSGGYSMSLKLRKVEGRVTEASASPEKEEPEETPENEIVKGGQYTLTETKKGYYTAAEALAGKEKPGHPTGVRRPGTYWIFNISQGMLNLSTSKTVPGSWINPN